ncbi:Flp family type IVb pilin [Acidocella sp.]|uniref:Flp family type IVb pilin n=1 Tax=Acidocella sp. TaxID=50710 RepID=UPI0025B7B91E|nr:Flp family type IVb pilin [Acidocella sp.]
MLVSLWDEMRRFRRDRQAVTAIEYVLIASLAAMVIIDGVTNIGGNLARIFSAIAAAF